MKVSFIVAWVALSACTLAAESIEPLPIAEKILINGIEVSTAKPPRGTAVREKLGLLTVDALDGQVVHRTSTRILETRATITPGGDYLLMFPEGEHYANAKGRPKVNSLIAYRSKDRGRTWQGPAVAYDIPYSQHGFIPLVPRGTKRLYAFGTQPIVGYPWENGQHENAPIGYRYSDDDGYTWSDVNLIAPTNDPDFRGMSVMRMTETDGGAWLVGSHIADWSVKPIKTKQYLLRSEDRGATWTVMPAARPGGWFAEGFDRMDEGRPLNLGGGRVLFMSRTPEGHLFTAFSTDDSKTFTKPAPSTLVHPDAPPMVFPLSDGKTLVALHHNRTTKSQYGAFDNHSEGMKVRSEIWASTSTDGGHTWSDPRWLLANVAAHTLKSDAWNYQCSYIDAFTDGGKLHLFMPHRWQQALYMTIDEKALTTLPTKAELKQAVAASVRGGAPKLWRSYHVADRVIDPLAPPQGLKTYRDVGLIVDETMLVRTPSAKVAAKATKFVDRTGSLFEKPNQWKVTKDANSNTLWCSYSKDGGKSWSVPRFVAALVTEGDSIVDVELGKASGKSLIVMVTSLQGRYDVRFREDDLCRLATQDDIQQAPLRGLVLDTVADDKIGTNMIADRPSVAGYRVDRELGLFLHDCIDGHVLHTAESDVGTLYESRGVVTPGGDYLVFIPDGRHANSPRDDANRFVAYRSKDQGRTWTKLGDPFGSGEKHHAALPLVSHDGRLYVLETLRGAAVADVKSGRAFGYRVSDDDGHHWSQPQLIHLDDGKTFGGTGVIQPTESAAGTWMSGFHHSKILRGELSGNDRQWSIVLPDEKSNLYHMDELRVLALEGSEALAMARTCEGHLWQSRSNDDGRTWSAFQPTSLVHADSPAMLFALGDGRLIALHHNRAVMRSVHEPVHSDWLKMPMPTSDQIARGNKHRHSLKDWVSRSEIWFSLSDNGGRQWSEPRLLFVNALAETLDAANPNYQCAYVDLFVDHGRVHLIVPHRWQRVVHLTFDVANLGEFKTREQLAQTQTQ